MSIKHYELAKQLIENDGSGDFEGAKPETLVAKAEAALGQTFPPSYRRFLLELGCGDINGLEIFGLINDQFENSSIPNGIWLTLDLRKNIGLPPQYIVIGDDGDQTFYALDTGTKDPAGEAPVLAMMPDGTMEQLAPSFGTYLLQSVKDVL